MWIIQTLEREGSGGRRTKQQVNVGTKRGTWVKARNVCVIITTIIINTSIALSQIWNPRSMLLRPGQCSKYSDLLWAWQFRVRNPVGGKRLSFSHLSRQVLGTTHPPVQWVLGGCFPGHGNDYLTHLELRLRMSRVIPLIPLYAP